MSVFHFSLVWGFLFYISLPAFPAFYLDREIEYIDINLDEVGNRFTRTISFSFMSVCNVDQSFPDCIGEEHNYKFGLSLNNEG